MPLSGPLLSRQHLHKGHPGCFRQLPKPNPSAHGHPGGAQGMCASRYERDAAGYPPLGSTCVLLVPVEQSFEKYKFALKKMVGVFTCSARPHLAQAAVLDYYQHYLGPSILNSPVECGIAKRVPALPKSCSVRWRTFCPTPNRAMQM
eukprot:scaffold14506_cov22-Tisochrysis_lutea.AAC.2